MKISELRTSLWGYRKGDVCEYVAELDEQFSARLTEREAMVIDLRYFHGLTQERVARILGVSQVQVSRIEKKALGHLRQML